MYLPQRSSLSLLGCASSLFSNGDFPPVSAVQAAALPNITWVSDLSGMSAFKAIRTVLARKAAMLAIAAIAAADVGSVVGGPHWPFYILAVIVLASALVVASRRALPRLLFSAEQLGFQRNRDWIHYYVELKGTPRGYIPLSLLWFVGSVLTGMHFPYFAVALASGLLLVAWAADRRKYPADLCATDAS